ncbi:hypothetical protein GTZ99_12410 [Novosphingobium sp. FSY-8]|uniref:Phage head morphogenesis domain-containing protein n=1 Tax=Novosphingobium ovatum TaxID=1908523 RepID=A0ABW9XFN3_9SPHN|nr:phage minor head protein [Novosphingobium ovatum]NBC37353.1 hypothetical protein [Novosphingobium ovatum]
MRYDLAGLVQRAGRTRRREIVFREVRLPGTLASDLYAAIYAPVLDVWGKAIAPLIDEYQRSLSEITTDAAPELSGVITSTDAATAALLVTLRVRLERWAAMVEAAHRSKWLASINRATGIDAGMMIGPGDMRATLGTVIERNVELVRSVSDQARSRISDAVFRGLTEKRPAREVAAQIREAVAMGRRRALNIASDQLSKAAETLNDQRRAEAGLSTWEWVSSHKAHPRAEHAARDGKRYDDKAKSGPHKPPQDRPGQLIHCGCTSRAVLTLDGEF